MADRLIQLAKNLKDLSPKALSAAFEQGGFMSEKLDGVWMAAVCIDGRITFYSSTREEYVSFKGTQVERDIQYLHVKSWTSFVLIGEAYHPTQDQSWISGKARTLEEGAAHELEFRVHDMLKPEEFEAGKSGIPYGLRQKKLELFLQNEPISAVSIIDQLGCGSEHELETFARAIQLNGGEGACYRPWGAGWEAGNRGTNLIRVKEQITYDLRVIRVGEVTEGPKGGLKGVIYVRFRPNADPMAAPVDLPIRGMTHDQLRSWADNPGLIVGQIVEVHAMKFSSNGLLREPRFKSIRYDKKVADL